MKAIVQKKYGSPDLLEVKEVELPEVGEDEVLVRVRAASLHPDVWHMVCGRPWILRLMGGGLIRPRQPIPGTDVAGVVEEVGSRVTRFRIGDAVFGETVDAKTWAHGGAYAEFVAVAQDLLASKPDNVTFEQAASVPASGYITLLNLRDPDQIRPHHRVLINGAGGGVGTLAVQIAKAQGAHVTAVDCAVKFDMLRALGADEVVDYTVEDFTRRGHRYHLIFDVPGSRRFADFRPALEVDGRYVPIGHEHFGKQGRRVFGLVPHFFKLMFLGRFTRQLRGPKIPRPGRKEAMAILSRMLSAGQITPWIDRSYPMDEVHEAFRRMVEGETLGKVILIP